MPIQADNTETPINWDTVFDVELDRIYNYLIYRLGEPAAAQDVTAETFETAWKIRHRYNANKGTAQSWLFGIARKRAGVYLKRHKRKQEVALSDEIHAVTTPLDEQFDRGQLKTALRHAIQTIAPRDQEIIALKYGAGLNNRQIAKQVSLSESNVGTIIYRTVAQLRQRLEGER